MGKTTMADIQAFHKAYCYPGTTIVIISATKPQAMEVIYKLKRLMRTGNFTDFKELLPSQKESKSEIVIKGPSGGKESRIISLPATDAARGYTADLVIVDEAAFIENGDYIFNQVIEPMTQATDGDILLLSTPNGKQGFFYEAFASEHWSSYQFPWWANPDNTGVKMERKREMMTAVQFEAEYEAKFTTAQKAYFSYNDIHNAVSKLSGQGARPGGIISFGVDFGKHHDNSIICMGRVINPQDPPEKHIIRVEERIVKPLGTDYAEVIGEIRAQAINLKPTRIELDGTGVGEVPSEMLCKESGLNAETIKFSIQKKMELFSNLQILFEQGRLQIPNDKEMLTQLELFEWERTESGNLKLHAPDGKHDDEVDALALMVWGLTRGLVPPVSIKII